MADNTQSGRNWRNVVEDEDDDLLPNDYDVADDDENEDDELTRPASRRSESDVREGEYRILREDTAQPRRSTAMRTAAAPSRQRTANIPSTSYDYDANEYPTNGSALNAAYAAPPTRGGMSGGGAVIRVPRSVPWLSIGCFGILAAIAIFLVVLAISLGGAVGGIGGFFGGLFGGGKTTYQIDTSSTAVVQQMQGLNRMETAQYTIEKVIAAYQKSDFLDQLYGGKVLFIANAKVTAGIDMSKLQEGDIKLTSSVTGTREVSVQLPKAEIFATTLDESKSYIYSADSNSIFGRLDPKIFDLVRATAQDEIGKAAQEQGILEMADKNARMNTELFLRRLGFTNVTFK